MVLNHLICSFYLVISLKVHRRGEVTFDTELSTYFSISFIVKLLSIISYDCIRYAKPTNDVSLDEITSLGLGDCG